MRIPTIYTETSIEAHSSGSFPESILIEGNAAHHIANVLRMKPGDELRLINGNGFFYSASLVECSKKHVSVRILRAEPSLSESRLHTHLGQVMSRGDRMDYAIQKSTELGVNEITPLMSERCELKLKADREHKRLEHWQQVAISAAEQCGRATVPVIHPVCSLDEWLSKQGAKGLSLVFHHRDSQNLTQIQTAPGHVNLLIGPEGGLSEDEILRAKDANFIACTFGPRVMRTETAPVACLSILQWLWGDFQHFQP